MLDAIWRLPEMRQKRWENSRRFADAVSGDAGGAAVPDGIHGENSGSFFRLLTTRR
jgi:hypothetical protein